VPSSSHPADLALDDILEIRLGLADLRNPEKDLRGALLEPLVGVL
jgi:hypothetical protein